MTMRMTHDMSHQPQVALPLKRRKKSTAYLLSDIKTISQLDVSKNEKRCCCCNLGGTNIISIAGSYYDRCQYDIFYRSKI